MIEEQQTTQSISGDLAATLFAGAAGGFVATTPMTVAMELMRQHLPWWERYPLPPSEILTKHPARRNALVIATHVVCGAVLGSVAERIGPQHDSE
jgi:hypothetical protein